MNITVESMSLIANIWVTENGVKNLYLRYGDVYGEPTWYHMGMSGHRTLAKHQEQLEEAYKTWAIKT